MLLRPVLFPWIHSTFITVLSTVILIIFASTTSAATKIRNGADPTVMKLGNNFYSAESAGGGIWVREATSIVGLGDANVVRRQVWSDSNGRGDIWAPEITTDGGRTYIYFTAGKDAAHRMFYISASSPLGAYTVESKLNLPNDQWAIDGILFTFGRQRYFVWSGWDSVTNNQEQNLYICRMSSPTQPDGGRYIISQPREPWEINDRPLINESPEAIIDPNGQLHIVYSANGSWDVRYCLGDLRLRKDGDPTYVWDWYKSNGCLFGSQQSNMMSGWDATLSINGPGHHTFQLLNGDINQSPGGTNHIPFVFHGVEKGIAYNWNSRSWFTGSFVWWGSTTYRRANVPGANADTGYGFKFFE